MSKRSADELDTIIRQKMPGFHLVRRPDADARSAADAPIARHRQRRAAPASSTPSISDLRAKYLGGRDKSRIEPQLVAAEDEAADIVRIEPDNADDEARHSKAIVISSDGEILGAQG